MSQVQDIAKKKGITYDVFAGRMRAKGIKSELTTHKVWYGMYNEKGEKDVFLSTLQVAAEILDVPVRELL